MEIQVFKFGGASVAKADGFRNVANIMQRFKGKKTILIVSAIGKTTNALEQVVSAYIKSQDAKQLLDQVKKSHHDIIQELFGSNASEVWDEVSDHFVEIDWILEDEVHDPYDYIYDQIVSIGEMVSSTILSHFLSHTGLSASWLDARGVIRTDEYHRHASVDFEITQPLAVSAIGQLIESSDIIVTQGFIGSTADNNTTTLGREGSDYTAGIFSYCLDAESMHIWKDVPGILTADPRLFEHTTRIDRLSYKEAIEMTYYGAKVIHPKTIKPLQNKSIPLYVRPFDNPESEGTLINDEGSPSYPPIIVVEPNQSLLHISTRDFSFVAEHHLEQIFKLFATYHIKVNMMRNTAISFTASTNHDPDKLQELINGLSKTFNTVVDHNLELVTIRHYDQATVDDMKEGKMVLYEENLRNTYQMVVKDIPRLKRKSGS